MSCVIRATTPTFKYTFATVNVANISQAYLTIAKNGTTVLEKSLADATVGEDYISWTLTQAETLSLLPGTAAVMLNWLTRDGTRGSSGNETLVIERNLKEVVI